MMILYHMWLAMNEARDAAQIEDLRSIARRTLAAMEERHNVQTPSRPRAAAPAERWLRPREGWCKANTDDAFHSADGRGGIWAIIRDHHGSFVGGAGHFLPHTFDAEGAELLACRHAALLAKEFQVKKLVLETDNQGVGLKLQREEEDHSVHRHLVEEVRSML
jgi:hypothetical protein